MKLLLTADLHTNIPTRGFPHGKTVREMFAESVAHERPDVIVIAGDLGTATNANYALRVIREAAGDVPVAVVLGNHDFWLPEERHDEFPSLTAVVEGVWKPLAETHGIHLLDSANLEFGGLMISGGYGHYDLSFAQQACEIGGSPVTREIYLKGVCGAYSWNDFKHIPRCGADLDKEARLQAQMLATRLDEALLSGRKLIVATHTCPWSELNGWPSNERRGSFYRAYSGNSLLGGVLGERAEGIALHFCGHTHKAVRELSIQGIRSFNMGTDYGAYRAVVYNTDDESLRWIGEMVW